MGIHSLPGPPPGWHANSYQTFTSLPPGGLQTLTKRPKHLPQTLTFCSKHLHFGARLPLSAPLNPPSPQHSHRLRASGRTHPHTPGISGLYSFLAPFCRNTPKTRNRWFISSKSLKPERTLPTPIFCRRGPALCKRKV